MRDLSLHIMDIIQNSIAAKASQVAVSIKAGGENGMLVVLIEDNGAGMDQALLNRVTDPFATTRMTRKVGMGIPLLKASAERASGGLQVYSEKGKGTVVKAVFRIADIDRPPIGDVAETVISVIMSSPEVELILDFANGSEVFGFNSFEIKEKLQDVPITEYAVLAWIREYVNEGIQAIFGGVLDEIDC